MQVGAPGKEAERIDWVLHQIGPIYAGGGEVLADGTLVGTEDPERWHVWLGWATTSGGEERLDRDPDAQRLKAELQRRGIVDEDERQGPPPPIEEVIWVDENDGTEHQVWKAT